MRFSNQNKTLNVKDSYKKRKQRQMDSYDTVGDGSMQGKNPKTTALNTKDKQTYEVKFINGTMDMKVLLKELIACRMDKKYEH
ncbi:hypothetical protein Aargi30884_08480 [Amedibacterium intestinale]|uniref:Uncharacterized protein n=2 Tax=Amedibacterium intestinale TaxID=2583452 RepID=A0A6N4THP3_9FIRM|nr:hypothetical protein DW208_07480 [Erysipelotrichaceae bacterium AM17-60]BBK21945.1 hypothetical protein Aargi30884_08480 [Amedibacterium intestinale]